MPSMAHTSHDTKVTSNAGLAQRAQHGHVLQARAWRPEVQLVHSPASPAWPPTPNPWPRAGPAQPSRPSMVLKRLPSSQPCRARPLEGLYRVTAMLPAVPNPPLPWQGCLVVQLRYTCQGPAALLQAWQVRPGASWGPGTVPRFPAFLLSTKPPPALHGCSSVCCGACTAQIRQAPDCQHWWSHCRSCCACLLG